MAGESVAANCSEISCVHASIAPSLHGETEFFIDNLLVRIHFIIVMIGRTGLASWEVEFPFPGSLTEGGARVSDTVFRTR